MRLRPILLAAAVVALSVGSVDRAEAQKARKADRPAAAPVRDKTRLRALPGARKGQPLKVNRADLSCVITARADGGAVILDGASLRLAHGGSTARAHVFVRNEGGSHAGVQAIEIDVKRDGQLVEQVAEPMPPLPPSDFRPRAVEFDLSDGTHAWLVEARVDVGDAVEESDEKNNGCALAFTSHVDQ